MILYFIWDTYTKESKNKRANVTSSMVIEETTSGTRARADNYDVTEEPAIRIHYREDLLHLEDRA